MTIQFSLLIVKLIVNVRSKNLFCSANSRNQIPDKLNIMSKIIIKMQQLYLFLIIIQDRFFTICLYLWHLKLWHDFGYLL